MVRVKKHSNGADYVLIDTDAVLYEGDQVSTIVPIQVQVRMKDLNEKQQKLLYRNVAMYFDRTFSFNKSVTPEKKGWFSRWFK